MRSPDGGFEPPIRMRLQHRIAIPFALVAIVTMAAAALLARSFFSRALESRVAAQVQNTARVIGQRDFALNAQILRSATQIAAADIITYRSSGEVLATTLDRSRDAALVRAVATPEAAQAALAAADDSTVVRHISAGMPYIVGYRRVVEGEDTVVAVIADTAEIAGATRAITRTIVAAALIFLVLMLVVSQTVARRVTAPLDALVAFVREASPEETGHRAPEGTDEIGRLARAFNDMMDRLRQSRAALVQSEKMGLAGLMAARVAHEIRNPLSSIKMQTQLLGDRQRGDAAARPLIDAVLRDVEQVESVVRDLIELARPGELQRRPTALQDVILDVLRQLAPQLSYRGIEVRPEFAAGVPLVDLDERRFRQVLLNIIGNAADAMPTGGTLAITLSAAAERAAVVLDVVDDGTGVDPKIRSRLFDPFVSTKRDGVGLGLVNAKAVVEHHAGTIELTAAAPRGTRARIVLPASRPGRTAAAGPGAVA